MPVYKFQGSSHRAPPETTLTPTEYIDYLIRAAADSQNATEVENGQPEGVVVKSFLCTLPGTMVPLKLAITRERWGLTIEEPDSNRIVLFREYLPPPRKQSKSELRLFIGQVRSGLEVIIRRPISPSAEYTILGGLIGRTSDEFATYAHEDLPRIVDEIRNQLQNLAERRAHPRIPAEFPLLVYPLYPDGIIGSPIGGTCRDVSLGGIKLSTSAPIRTERIYIEFHQFQPLNGQAIYVRVLRTTQDPETLATITSGRFHSKA
jgi:hypothetical protein